MSLSWNEVRDRAIKFSRQWAGETSERHRVACLFAQYEQLTLPLVAMGKVKRGRQNKE